MSSAAAKSYNQVEDGSFRDPSGGGPDEKPFRRLYETHGEKAEAMIELPWPVDAVETDLIERPTGKGLGSGPSITVPLAPYEIKTILVKRR